MKKTLFLLMALASVATAADTTTPPSSTFDFDFSDSLLSDDAAALRTVSFMDGNFRATITADTGTNTLSSGDWSKADGDDTGTIPAEGTPAYDYIKGGNTSTNLTLTLSNLVAGEKYSFSFTTGIPFERAGTWNTIRQGEGNTYASRTRTPADSTNDDSPEVRGITTYTYTDIVADSSGKISITIDTSAAGNHTPSFNVASLSGASKTEGNLGYVFAASATQSGNAALIVREGSTGNNWAAAFGNAAEPDDDSNFVLTGNASIKFTGDYTGGKYTDENNKGTTVFGIVNAEKVTGNVNLVFDAAHANYGSFSDTNAASVVGAYQGTIVGTFSATINSGTFAKDIMGGIHTGNTDSIGATSLAINGGTIGGNVYGGGVTGTINGNTAVSITSLIPFASHTASNIISAGGTGGTIEGDASVSFSGVSGSYAGTVSGGSNVEGTSSLSIAGSSTLSLKNVVDFDTIDIAEGSSLTITGSLSGGSGIGVAYDANSTHITNKTNGLGDGIFDLSSYITGEGSFAMDEGATYNGKAITDVNGNALTVADTVYYVMGSVSENDIADTQANSNDAGYVYRLSPTKTVSLLSVVNVGTHTNTAGPTPTIGANDVLGYYVGENGTLCVSADTTDSGLTVQNILANTEGSGDIILRSPGYDNNSTSNDNTVWNISFADKTKLTGNLYISPYVQHETSGVFRYHNGVNLTLEEGADVSSLNSITLGYTYTKLQIAGKIGSDTSGNHINNLKTLGSGFIYIDNLAHIDEEIVFGGSTVLQSYKFNDSSGGNSGSQLYLTASDDTSFRIRHLSSGTDGNSDRPTGVYLNTGAIGVNAVLHIDSFDYDGSVNLYANSAMQTGSLHANITLLENQSMRDRQVYRTSNSMSASITRTLSIKGSGTYILSDGSSIDYSYDPSFGYSHLYYNFGTLSDDWNGTVEVNKLDATGNVVSAINGVDWKKYGNQDSTIHIKGFRGNVTSESNVSKMILDNVEGMSAYEVTGGIAKQNYTGSISGEGDFVVSAAGNMDVTLSGDITEWKGNLKATAGEQTVTFSGAATEVNAAVTAEGGNLALKVDNSGKTTTFNQEVNVTSLTVNSGSIAMLTKESTAGTVKLTGEALELSDGISITDKTLRSGSIAYGSITSTATNGTVELDGISASNLRLYGKDVTFHSDEEDDVFMAEEVGSHTEVSFSSDIFKGMTLSNDGAKATITVSNTILDGGLIKSTNTNNVTIFLEGFTIEALNNSSGVWNWDEQRLSFNVPEVATLSGEVTVQELLAAKYASVTYSQMASGLMIRMQNIPEPTSATLSLLALAGLAARRRRK